jgi:hypothetical protein
MIISILIIVAAVGIVGFVSYWAISAPRWDLYQKNFSDTVKTVEELNSLKPTIIADIEQNFIHFNTLDFSGAEAVIVKQYPLLEQDPEGKYYSGCTINLCAWVWRGSDNHPSWKVVKTWTDWWRTKDYSKPDAKMAQFGNASQP